MIRMLHEDALVRVEYNPSDSIVRIARTSEQGTVDLAAVERALAGIPARAKLLVDTREGALDVSALSRRFARVAVLGKGGFADEDAALDSLME